ncbi:MAG: hypothetical protein A3G75_06630 [Verrucomicrobia bacterium RIFCSPLOWO2_12_FULL_64_8]|nr:MAG: hypothetical protein A3G75_06630 [Verrucomicrobia bacterium RIFCSPLOWO2_12_FULL_64_8]
MRLAAPWSFKHRPTARYWECYGDLPAEIRVLADKCIGQLNENPDHPSLRFRKNGLIWSINVGPDHKALAIETSSGYLWFWIGLRGRVDSAKDRR